MTNIVQYKGNQSSTANSNRRASANLWSSVPVREILDGTVDGVYVRDDFDKLGLIGTQTTQIGYGAYKVFATANAAVTPVSAVNSVEVGRGVLALTHAADNDSASLAQSYPAFDAIVNGIPLVFECRIAVKSLLTLRNGFFVGLGETNLFTLATAVPFNADAAVPTNGGSLLGFNKWEIVSTTAAATTGLSGGINTSYTDRATSFSQIQADAAIMSAAFTFIKLGMYYNPADSARAVRFYADGLELSSAMTAAQITATTNLKAKSLGLMVASIAAASVSTDATYLDWWQCAQWAP